MNDLPNQILGFMREEVINRKNNNPNIKDKAYIFSKNDIYNTFDFNPEDIDEALKILVDNNCLEKWIIGSYKLLDED